MKLGNESVDIFLADDNIVETINRFLYHSKLAAFSFVTNHSETMRNVAQVHLHYAQIKMRSIKRSRLYKRKKQ